MTERERERIIREFRTALNTAWLASGVSSYGEAEKASRELAQRMAAEGRQIQLLHDSTICDHLRGPRLRLPRWPFVLSLITVLRAVAERNGVDPARVGGIAHWKGLHEKAERALAAARLGVGAAAGRGAGRGARGAAVAVAEAGPAVWWAGYEDLVPGWLEPYLTAEPAATLVRVYDTRTVPELLQTPAYARAALRARRPHLPAEDLHRHVELRTRRQRILAGVRPPRLWALLDEVALHRPPGGGTVLREQIGHLLELTEERHVTVQIVPPDGNGQPQGGGPVTLLRFAESERPDLVYLPQPDYALYPGSEADVSYFSMEFSKLAIMALSPAESRGLLERRYSRRGI
ncbi:DUF5753 domain-containing protein [Actinocorallia populi]|uniref:DUF5753 domain-containing protein n=1 Tax=Actinocorallia populi TaxID=2079200 RepID=UPI000D08A236|nr:DUF5753 domain-containing protein [Actinocorallia populi]